MERIVNVYFRAGRFEWKKISGCSVLSLYFEIYRMVIINPSIIHYLGYSFIIFGL